MSAEGERPAEARPAATVILLRRGGKHSDRGLEVLMLRRGQGARFMPGVWVFAGGVVEPQDAAAAGPGAGIDSEEAHRACGARELGEEASVSLVAEDLLPWSRVITPEAVPIRFDTRFYVALAPAHCRPQPEPSEMEEARWIAPSDALAAAERGEMEISFPTLRHLEELSGFDRAGEVIEAAADREIEPILPKVRRGEDGEIEVLLPGQPGYEEA